MSYPKLIVPLGPALQWLLFALFAIGCSKHDAAEPISAKYPEGTLHAFIALTDAGGKTLAAGDLVQIVRGDRVTIHLVFHFKDGSLDDETTVLTQSGTFRLLTDHHFQRGPFFPHPIDVTIDAPQNQVTVRTTNKDGKQDVSTNHMDLPSDLCNGFLATIVKNVEAGAQETKVSMLVMTPKPRIVTMAISPGGEDSFSVAGVERKARMYTVKIELGGVTGMIAPLVGKAPPDLHVWIVPGEVPIAIREEAPLFEDSPLLTFSMTSPTWPKK